MAPSRSGAETSASTGPKISSRASSDSGSDTSTSVGPRSVPASPPAEAAVEQDPRPLRLRRVSTAGLCSLTGLRGRPWGQTSVPGSAPGAGVSSPTAAATQGPPSPRAWRGVHRPRITQTDPRPGSVGRPRRKPKPMIAGTALSRSASLSDDHRVLGARRAPGRACRSGAERVAISRAVAGPGRRKRPRRRPSVVEDRLDRLAPAPG